MITARFLPQYPKRINVTDGLTKTEANGVVTLGFDYVASEFGIELQQAVDSTAAHDASAAAHDTSAAASATSASSSAASALQSAMTAAGGTYDTVAVAAAIKPDVAPNALRVNGYSTAGDGGAALYAKVASEPSHTGKFSITLSDNTTVVWYEIAENAPRPQMFGAKGDATTDDKTAIQNTINYCLSFTKPKPMMLTALHFVSASLIVNRAIGGSAAASDFNIIGLGSGAGFTANAITIIDSDITTTDTPVSCNLAFQFVTFIGGGDANTIAVSWKYVRVNFESCRFNIIRCVQAPLYLQSWRWHHCSALSWPGLFCSCLVTYYDCHWDNNTFESGGDGIKSFNGGFDGSSITNNLFENSGQFFFQNTGLGTTITGNYTEGNSKQDYVLSDPSNGGFHRGTVFQGNYAGLNTHGLYNVVVGDARGMIAGGNYNDDKMYDTTFTSPHGMKSIGDYAANSKFSTANKGWELDNVGEFGTGSGVYASLTNNTAVNLWTVTLDPGDYDIEAICTFEGTTSTTVSALAASLSTTSDTIDFSNYASQAASGTIFIGGNVFTVSVRARFNLTATTTIYAVGLALFANSTCSAKATINWRRAA
jgi:hypothetical protein